MDRSNLNVLYFSRGYTTHDYRFLKSFVDAGCRVSHLQLVGEQLENRALPQGVRAIAWVGDVGGQASLSEYLARYTALRHILWEERPQVVLAGPVQTSAFLVALTGYRRLVTMSWGSDILVDATRNLWMRKITKYALRHSRGVLCDCRAVSDRINTWSAIADDDIVMFPWGIDLERFFPDSSALSLREDLGWRDKPILISTRTWEPLYAIDVLVHAFATVLQRHAEVRLILLGDGSQDKIIRKLICELNLNEYIYAPGRVRYELLPDYFRLSDVYVSTALSDGTSISLLEAMACGLPTVVANGYGNLEWVKPGRNGWLVNPGDSVALAAALDEALSDSQHLAQIKQANIELARARADWNKNFPQLLQLLQRVARQPSVLDCRLAAYPIDSRIQ